MLPKGIRLLRSGIKRSEAHTVRTLNECCAAHLGGCGYEAECEALYDARCGEWPLYKPTVVRLCREITDTQKYSTWVPQISRRELIANATAN